MKKQPAVEVKDISKKYVNSSIGIKVFRSKQI